MLSATDSISNTDKTNYLNIGLMILSCAVAFFVPFELFLFSYAVLGPLHYLTEISWLHERKYFTKGKYDFIFLGIAGLILFLLFFAPSLNVITETKDAEGHVESTYYSTVLVYLAFIASLAMVLLTKTFHRFIAFLVICASAFVSKGWFLLFSVFMPTLIHVFLFTALFMLYGALKARSMSGYISCIILLIIPFIIFFVDPGNFGLSNYAMAHYQKFSLVNQDFITYFFGTDSFKAGTTWKDVIYKSSIGFSVMRFIAFAYTYHYLNWFSKTTVIKWHKVPKMRLLIIGILWIASVIFYLVKYELGFEVLFFLSFLHVFLEFPLNHVTIIGIFKETGAIISGKKVPVPVKGNVGKVKKK